MSLFDKDIVEKELPFRVILQNKIIDIIGDGMERLKYRPVNDGQISSETWLEYYVKNAMYYYLQYIGATKGHSHWNLLVFEEYTGIRVFSGFRMISVIVKKELCDKLDKDLEFTLTLREEINL